MLRSLLILALLVPCVTALPSKYLSDARRSASLESGSSPSIPQSLYSTEQQVGSSFPIASAQPGYLDRDRTAAVKGKQRKIDSQDVLRKPHHRRDEIFPSVVAVNSTLQTGEEDGSGRTLTIVFEQANGTESTMAVAPPSRRWGQTATFLPAHNVVLVVGGQTGLSGAITNDVWALDVSGLSSNTSSSNATSQSWRRLSSEGLPAHAYAAASSVIDPADSSEKLWIVGGVTQNCVQDAPAYVWSAPVGNITAGNWTAVYPDNGVSPSRRRGAKAVALATTNSTSIMVSGGTYDVSTCASSNGTYMGVDMWSQSSSFSTSSSPLISSSSATAHVVIDIAAGTSYSSVQSLALDPRMRDFSLTDYTTVVLPANGTCGEKVLFLGGKDQNNNLAPLDKFWALDVATGDWEHWNATGLIPSGRMGHTAVATPTVKSSFTAATFKIPQCTRLTISLSVKFSFSTRDKVQQDGVRLFGLLSRRHLLLLPITQLSWRVKSWLYRLERPLMHPRSRIRDRASYRQAIARVEVVLRQCISSIQRRWPMLVD